VLQYCKILTLKIGGLTILSCFLICTHSIAQDGLAAGYQYVFPGPRAKFVHPNSTLILRFKKIAPAEITNLHNCIRASGEKSGTHSGKTIIASDQRTLIFESESSFIPGEKVRVSIDPHFPRSSPYSIESLNYEFTVLEEVVAIETHAEENQGNLQERKNESIVKPVIMSNGISVPADFPMVNIIQNSGFSNDYIFVNTSTNPYYNIIFNTSGEPVWYSRSSELREDFRVQSNGWITMQDREGLAESDLGHIAFTQNFEYIKPFQASNGYTSDEHEFFMLPDSGYFLIGKRDTKVDMSQYVEGGRTDATVRETCIQEFTADDQLVFIWRAWDHFDIRDVEIEDLTGSIIRFPHMNAIFTDDDGHILLSSRHLSEISKIHRQTGEFIWRMSGTPDSPNNEFQFLNDPLNGFRNQHAIRSLGNKRYTLLDNGNMHIPPLSRAVEYEIDTVRMTATLIWEYRHDSDNRVARFMGNTQRLPNGNTHINWAVSNYPTIALEVTPGGENVFEMWFENGANCYRSFRHPWNGNCPVPYLLLEPQTDNLTLIFNKFGDENVDYYNIYGGTSPNPTTLIDSSGSTLKKLSGLQNEMRYYFKVKAVDKSGVESDFSNEEDIYVNLTQPGKNLIINGDFSNDLDAWDWEVNSLASAEVEVVNYECNFLIHNGGQGFNDIQLSQDSILLIQGQNYMLEFDAWAEYTRAVELKFTGENTPFADYSRIGYSALNSAAKHYMYYFEMEEPTDNNSRLEINAGNSDVSLFIDNLSLKIDGPVNAGQTSEADSGFLLYSNYPNPFNQFTTIGYEVPTQCHVTLAVFDGVGRLVDILVNQMQAPGPYKTMLDASKLVNGVYYYQMVADDFIGTKKMLLIR